MCNLQINSLLRVYWSCLRTMLTIVKLKLKVVDLEAKYAKLLEDKTTYTIV
jgi:hypothetical protein